MDTRLPLEILRDKYLPVNVVSEKYNIPIDTLQSLIDSRKIRYAELRAPGESRRSVHINPEDVFSILELDKEKS